MQGSRSEVSAFLARVHDLMLGFYIGVSSAALEEEIFKDNERSSFQRSKKRFSKTTNVPSF
jgi:hypothetical protein